MKTSGKAPDMESEGLDRTELESIKRVPPHGRPSPLRQLSGARSPKEVEVCG